MTSSFAFAFGIVTHTPIWVWAIFALVGYLGWQRTKDRTVEVWRLLILPVVMILVSASGIAHQGAGIDLPAILAGLAVGGIAGWMLERDGASRRLPDGRLWLRGEWWSLVQVLTIFGFRYATIVAATINPAYGTNPAWLIATTFISSLLSALVLGRTLARLRVYFSAPTADVTTA